MIKSFHKNDFLTDHDRHIIVFTAGKNQIILDFRNDYIELDLPTVNKHQKLEESMYILIHSDKEERIDIFAIPMKIGDSAYITMFYDGIVMM